MADLLLSKLKGNRETANLIVIIRWGAGRKHQDITTQEPDIALRSNSGDMISLRVCFLFARLLNKALPLPVRDRFFANEYL
jgi:hypothetical protein